MGAAALAFGGASAHAQWPGFRDVSAEVDTARYDFGTAGGSNENYYDGDFGDFDGDGHVDRALISRYGLLWNAGGGWMVPVSTQRSSGVPPNSSPSLTGYLFGDEVSIGNDAVQWVDLDGDGDLDVVQGGNGEAFVVQENRGGRFAVTGRYSGSAVQIVTTDLERDGDADLIVACWFPSGPDDFSVFVNDGRGNLTEEAAARGLALAGNRIIGVASGDVDRDGDFDLVVLSRSAQQVWVMLNDGTGSFTRREVAVPRAMTFSSGFAQGTQLGDIDGDGDLDLVIAIDDYAGSHPRVGHMLFVNDGSGGFTEESAMRFVVDDSFSFSGRLVAGNGKLFDVDYDGDLDFVAYTDLAGPPLNLQLFLNDGSGRFVYTRTGVPAFGVAVADSVGADVDVADLDGDGTYDLWVGVGGGRVTQLRNLHRDPSGLPADVPRGVRAVVEAGGVRVSFAPPPFAATARHYELLRSVAPGLAPRDRERVRYVALSRFEDEGFSAPITARTTAAELRDPDVTIAGDRIEVLDRSAEPGVEYFYSVVHVGPENARSVPSPEVRARIDAPTGADDRGPVLRIVSPTVEEWSARPRIVVTYADGGSGVDPDTLALSLDRSVGAVPTGTDFADRAIVRTGSVAVVLLDDALPIGATTLTARIRDVAGNETSASVRFATTVVPRTAPSVSARAEPSRGAAPLAVRLVGEATAGGGGEVLAWEWTGSDGSTALGREVDRVYDEPGTYEIILHVRDDSGAAARASVTVVVDECTSDCDPPDAGPAPERDGGSGGGVDGGTPEDRIPARTGGGCAASDSATDWPAWIVLLSMLGRRRRRR